MKKLSKILFSCVALLSFMGSYAAPATHASRPINHASHANNQATLRVSVINLKSNQGVVRISMFDSPAAYKKAGNTGTGAYKRAMLPIQNNHASWTLRNIPYGCYAIKLYHDVNNSGKFATNAFGVPKVGYGFSNNPRTTFGPAPYSKARFCINQKLARLTINVVNRK